VTSFDVNQWKCCVGFEVFTAVTMKNAVFWDVAPCGFIINRRFGGKSRLHLLGTTNDASEEKCKTVANRLTTLRQPSNIFQRSFFSSTLKIETTRSSETSVYNKLTQRHIPEDGIFHNQNIVAALVSLYVLQTTTSAIISLWHKSTDCNRGRPSVTPEQLPGALGISFPTGGGGCGCYLACNRVITTRGLLTSAWYAEWLPRGLAPVYIERAPCPLT
jgi:hypothetical protein